MNVTAPSSILLSSSAGEGTAAPEGGEALPETGFAAHLLAQTLGETPRALPKTSTGAALAPALSPPLLTPRQRIRRVLSPCLK